MQLTRRAFIGSWLAAAAGGAAPGHAQHPADTLRGKPGVVPVQWERLGEILRERHRDPRRLFAFEYYPWYATDPLRHWQAWGRMPPVDIAASSMPLLGAYDSRAASVIEQHARWIAAAGVGVVNLSWWGVGSFADRAVPLVMDVMRAHDIHVAFHIEPYGRQRAARIGEDLHYLLRRYGERRRWDAFFLHERADGSTGPVFKWFESTLPPTKVDCHGVTRPVPDYIADATWRRAIDRARTMLDGRFDHVTLLATTSSMGRASRAGWDGIAIYDSAVNVDMWTPHADHATRHGLVYTFPVNAGLDIIDRRLPAADCRSRIPPFVPDIGPFDWSNGDDRERAHAAAVDRIDETLAWNLYLQLEPTLLGNTARGFFLVYINSFNEWHEGTQFEPMRPYGELTRAERAIGYHNPLDDGFARLNRLATLLGRLGL